MPWEPLIDSITSVNIANGITHIPENAFADCKNLATVTITAEQPAGTLNMAPELVIDYGAFKGTFKGTQQTKTLSLPFIGRDRTNEGVENPTLVPRTQKYRMIIFLKVLLKFLLLVLLLYKLKLVVTYHIQLLNCIKKV